MSIPNVNVDSTKDNGQANLGPILHHDSISFHLSHQPPLKVTEHFLCSKSDKKRHIYNMKSTLSLSEVVDGSMKSYLTSQKRIRP